jgi:biopolymer transport protein ExbB/TolQ
MEGNTSALDMFFQADPVVKGVMLLLFLASLACWVIIFEKSVILRRLSKAVADFKTLAAGLGAGRDIQSGPEATENLLAAGLAAAGDGAGGESRAEYRERVERAKRLEMTEIMERAGRRAVFLATVGSIGPFVGLFGTVWGIMNSFSGIAASGETSLAVVAPGIAEALFATATGLVAAIPAVVAYNRVSSRLRKIAQTAHGAIAATGDHLARLHFERSESAARERS